jgi:hypothetical protein
LIRHHILMFAMMLSSCGESGAQQVLQPQNTAERAFEDAQAAQAAQRDVSNERQKTDARAIKGCAVLAFAVDPDPAGLNVREAPDGKSRIVGKLYSLIETDPMDPDSPPIEGDSAFGPGFSITAISGVWLKIADIDPVTTGWDPAIRKQGKRRNYQGTGWVHRSKITVDPGFHDNAYAQPYEGPGDWQIVDKNAGDLLTLTGGKQGYTAPLLACERNWLKIRYQRDGRDREGWFQMKPNYVPGMRCDPADSDCPARQNSDIWN